MGVSDESIDADNLKLTRTAAPDGTTFSIAKSRNRRVPSLEPGQHVPATPKVADCVPPEILQP
jgi:hypothetical protein